jgi:hypothetical protein
MKLSDSSGPRRSRSGSVRGLLGQHCGPQKTLPPLTAPARILPFAACQFGVAPPATIAVPVGLRGPGVFMLG